MVYSANVMCNVSNASVFDKDLSALEAKWRDAGYYDGTYLRLAMEIGVLAAFIWSSVRLSKRKPLVGGVCIGLAMLANFRLAHHCGHEQGFFSPKLWRSEEAEAVTCILITNLGSGIDAKVWQHDHRLHHGYTTCLKDPQIRPAPMTATPLFSLREASLSAYIDAHPVTGAILQWQEVFWFPLLVLLGKHDLTLKQVGKMGLIRDFLILRKLCLAGHYVMLVAAMFCVTGGVGPRARWRNRLLWLLGVHVSGLVEPMFLFNHIQTGSQPTCTHNDKVSQFCHTVSYALRMPAWLPLDEWFIPVSWHIEHHIAPKIPDENLHSIAADVKQLAAKHGLPYRVEPLEKALWDFTWALAEVPRTRTLGGYCLLIGVTLAMVALVHSWVRATTTSKPMSKPCILAHDAYDVKGVAEEEKDCTGRPLMAAEDTGVGNEIDTLLPP